MKIHKEFLETRVSDTWVLAIIHVSGTTVFGPEFRVSVTRASCFSKRGCGALEFRAPDTRIITLLPDFLGYPRFVILGSLNLNIISTHKNLFFYGYLILLFCYFLKLIFVQTKLLSISNPNVSHFRPIYLSAYFSVT